MTINQQTLLITVDDNREVRKTNELITRPLVRGQFTLLARKLFNTMLFHAQQLGRPGANAPGPNEAYQRMFWVPLTDIAKDARFESGDTILLKETVRLLMDIQVETETDTEWTADHLVESVKIVNPAGLNKKGGRLWLGFRFPDEVMHLVMDPNRYTRLPLYYMTILPTHASVALYEAAKESAFKASGLTVRAHWSEWQILFEGKPREELQGWKSEYKYFRSRVLERAIVEVNTLTDIIVELIEHKIGRKAADLQFRVRKKTQQQIEFTPDPLINSALIADMMEFGVAKREAEDLMATHDEAYLRATLRHVNERLLNKQMPEISSPAAFFRSAIKGQYALAKKLQAKIPVAPAPTRKEEALVDADAQARNNAALATFDDLPDEEKDARWAAFLADNPAAANAYSGRKRFGLVARKAFAVWLARS